MDNIRYSLWLWEETGNMFIYDLGEHQTVDAAAFLAHSVMHANHSDFVAQGNSWWRVHKAGTITVRNAVHIESSADEVISEG